MFDALFGNPKFRNFAGDALSDLGYGMVNGQGFNGVMQQATNRTAQMQPVRDAYAAAQEEKLQKQQTINQTVEWMREKGMDDLVAGVETGGLDVGTAWATALQRMQPQAPKAPIKVGAGETLLDPNTMQPIYTGAPDVKDQFGYEKDLAAQYGSQDPVKTYQAVRNGYERVRTSAQQANGAGDISMIFAYMKMLDPTSVVREGEFATAENAGGVGATVANLYNKLLEGQRLTPELRRQFLQQAEGLYQESAGNLTDLNQQYTTRAGAWGVDPTRFVLSPETYQPLQLNTGWNDVGGGYRIREK